MIRDRFSAIKNPSLAHAHLREMERSPFSTISRQLRLREVEEVSVERLERDKERESCSERKKNSHLVGGHCSLVVLVKQRTLEDLCCRNGCN